jgi:probable rRNA maturation factor
MTGKPDPVRRKRPLALRARPTAAARAAPGRGRSPAAPRPQIDLAQPCAKWRRALPDVARRCAAAARAALARAGQHLPGPAELSIVLADDALLRRLNRKWRGLDKPTNVLAFPALAGTAGPGAPRLLGDVVLGFETVAREARRQEKALADHLAHLVVHGVLHLLGFDHARAAAARRMEAVETVVLSRLGIADPYHPREAADG